jgi:hypothetical protein
MTDTLFLIYGALTFLATYIFLKIIDMILEHFLNKTLFARIWNYLAKSVKIFLTRLKPIKICFSFRTQIEPSDLTKVKEKVAQFINAVSEKHEGRIEFSPLTWNEAGDMASTKVAFNQREFRLDIYISFEYRDFDPEKEIKFEKKETNTVSDSIAFSIETNFPFNALDKMLLSLNSLTNFLKDELNEIFSDIRFSKGMFTIAPMKGDFTMDHWIKEKQFEVSLLLKAQEKVLLNLYPKRAEIIFPTLQIDEKVLEYLKATLLSYYL